MELATWHSGRTGAARPEAGGYGRCRELVTVEPPLRGETTPLGDEEAIRSDAQAGMMVETPPAAALVVPQSDLLLQLLKIALDAPARLRYGRQLLEPGLSRQGRHSRYLVGSFSPSGHSTSSHSSGRGAGGWSSRWAGRTRSRPAAAAARSPVARG